MPDFDDLDFNDIDSKEFKRMFDDIVRDLEHLSPDDLPAALAKIWEKAGPALARKLVEKNFRLWGLMWENGIALSYMNGVTRMFPFDFAEPGLIRTAANDYFRTHGMSLVKSLTETDLKKLKAQMADNWGVGERSFARKFKDSYPVSQSRLELIFRTEHGLTENSALLDVSKKLGREYKVWTVIGDERTCEICGAHQDDTIPINEKFRIEGDLGSVRFIDVPRESHPGCFSSDTEIFTESGWKLFNDVDKDERIWTLNTDTGEPVLDVQKSQIAYQYTGDMIHIKNGRTFDCMVTPNHEMIVARPGCNESTAYIRKLAPDLSVKDRIPRSASWTGDDSSKINIMGREFDTGDFMSFMGWYISEGFVKTGKDRSPRIVICQQNEVNRSEIILLCKRMFGNVYVWNNKIAVPDVDDIVDYFVALGKSRDKYIPTELKQLSPMYLNKLLDSMIRGDGCKYQRSLWDGYKRRDTITYTTVSEKLSSDITELSLKLGFRIMTRVVPQRTNRVGRKEFTSGLSYVLYFGYNTYTSIRSHDMVKRVPYDGIVYCVEMENNPNIYVRRNGRANWSGNCRCGMKTVRARDLTSAQIQRLVANGYPDPQKQNSVTYMEYNVEYVEPDDVKLNYKCPENPPGSGNFKCEDGSGAKKEMDVKELTEKVKSLHTQRMGGHVKLRGILESSFSDTSKFQITGRVKSVESIQEKMKRKNVTDPAKFDDISGLRVVTSDANATQEAINMLKSKFKNVMVPGTEDNYIENPKDTGYRAYHLTVRIDDQPHEIQVRTERFNEWAEKNHALYKGEEWTDKARTEDTADYFKQAASVIQALDEGHNNVHMPPCPPELEAVHLCL